MARRLAVQFDLILEDAAMLADSFDPHLSKSQIETMLRRVVDRQLVKLDRLAYAAKNSSGFDFERERMGDKQAFWAFALLDAQRASAVVRDEDRVRMAADGLSEADIEAVKCHLTMETPWNVSRVTVARRCPAYSAASGIRNLPPTQQEKAMSKSHFEVREIPIDAFYEDSQELSPEELGAVSGGAKKDAENKKQADAMKGFAQALMSL
ncbi:hypothetical protein [Bradyrhizobium forestalis]|uniref:hypothetical protein n=1 Tax=Bradyrhizobium forestalis TaxID=1419263 RepID=UPI0011AEE2A0|nr:hypothetical protein [Bradyrhizobium forestalis]